MKIEAIKSGAPRPLANYNECFKVGPWVFAAGQIASDYKTGVAPEARKNPAFPYYGSDIKLQTHYVLGNLKKTFEAAGSSLDHVVKAQVFMTDLGNFNAFDEVWREYFKVPPARTTIGTTGLLVPGNAGGDRSDRLRAGAGHRAQGGASRRRRSRSRTTPRRSPSAI